MTHPTKEPRAEAVALKVEIKEYQPAGGTHVMIWVNDRIIANGGYSLECVPRHVASAIVAALSPSAPVPASGGVEAVRAVLSRARGRISRDIYLGTLGHVWTERAKLVNDIDAAIGSLASLSLSPAPTSGAEADADTGHVEADRVIGRLMSSDPDFDDCSDAALLIRKLVVEHRGPDGHATWKDAALAERAANKARIREDASQFPEMASGVKAIPAAALAKPASEPAGRDVLRGAVERAIRRFELLAYKRDRTDVDPEVGAAELRAALSPSSCGRG